jgi:hypothetical protein
MYGNARRRYCGECKLNVYNLSAMTKQEAEELITQSEGRLCVRFYQRADGTVITRDCPVGWAAVKKRVRTVATAFASLMVALLTGTIFASMFSSDRGNATVGKLIPFSTPTPVPLMGAIAPVPKRTPKPKDETIKMGEIEAPRKKVMREVTGTVEAPVVERAM